MAVPSSPPAAAAASQRKKRKNNNEEMEAKMEISNTQKEEVSKPQSRARTKTPEVRVVGGRIYDPHNGKTCHQCRQKTMDFAAGCKNMKGAKQCTYRFCHKCLLNRYGEKAEEMESLDDWKCPKCRGICNCSFCMKKRGHKPTGILVHTAKATGFSSVSELLDVKGPDACQEMIVKTKLASPKKPVASTEEPVVVSPKKRGKENSINGTCNANLNSQQPTSSPDGNKCKKAKREGPMERDEVAKGNPIVTSPCKDTKDIVRRSPRRPVIPREETEGEKFIKKEEKVTKKEEKKTEVQLEPKVSMKDVAAGVEKQTKVQAEPKTSMFGVPADVVLPAGTLLTSVSSIDFPSEDVGYVLQFLEFCSTFGEVLDIRKGQPHSVLRDIMCVRGRRKGKCSSAVQFFDQLMAFIQKDMEEEDPPSTSKDAWIEYLKECLSESNCVLEGIPKDCFVKGLDGYEMLESSQKLKLLTFLCDETLCTMEMRNWIDEQNSKFVEKAKEARESLNAAKEKEKMVKRKLQDKIAKAVIAKKGAPLTISEHESIMSKIKAEADRVHAEMTEAMDMLPKKNQISEAVRMEPVLLDDKGRAYWRLKSFSDSDILLQDVGGAVKIASNEKWFTFGAEEAKLIEKHSTFQRLKRERRKCNKLADSTTMHINNSTIEIDSSSNDDSPPTTANNC